MTYIFIFILEVALILYKGLILSFMWMWFIVPLGFQELSVALCSIILIMIHITKFHNYPKDDETTALAYSFGVSSALFVQSFLVSLFL